MSNCGGNVHVVVRVRPLTNPEQGGDYRWVVNGNQIQEVDKQKHAYVFDHIFDTKATTKEVYDKVAVPILQSVMDGYNGTIFAYGQTSSGKTHTMMGNKTNEGVIPRIAKSLFEYIEKAPTREFLLRVASIEIYNEKVYDLFSKSRKPLSLREDSKGQPYVEGLEWEFINSFTDLMTIMWKCEGNRCYGATAMNERSSRSHIIFSMIVESRFAHDVLDASGEGAVRVSQLNLVDLAGSERAGQMGSTGNRFKEGCAINSSLFVLGNVINKLTQADGQYINFRDSKLTRILQASLGGNAKTSIICTVTPDQIEETHSTLKFASTAKAMLNKPIVNEVLSDEAVLKQYARQLQDLRNEREALKEKERNQEQIERELEESNRKNQELEAKIRSLNERIIHSSSSSTIFATSQKSRRETWGGHLKLNLSFPDFDHQFSSKLPSEDLESFEETVEPLQSNDNERKKVVRFKNSPEVCSSATVQYEDVECQTEFDAELRDLENLKKENAELSKKNRHLAMRRAELNGLLKHKEELASLLDQELKEMFEFTNQEKYSVKNELEETKAKVELLERNSKEANGKIEFLERTSKDAENLFLDTTKKMSLLASENEALRLKLVHSEEAKNVCSHAVDERIQNYDRELVVARKRIEMLENEQKDHDVRFELQNERNEKLLSELKCRLQEAYDQIKSSPSKHQSRDEKKLLQGEEQPERVEEKLVKKIESLETLVSNLEKDLCGYEQLKETLKSANEEIAVLKRSEIRIPAPNLFDEEITDLRLKIVEESDERCSRTDDMSRLEVEVRELSAQIAALEAEKKELCEMRTMNVQFSDTITRCFAREEDFRTEIGSLGSRNVALSYDVKKLNAKNEELLENLREMELEREKWPLKIEELHIEHLEAREASVLRQKKLSREREENLRNLIRSLQHKVATSEHKANEAEKVSEGLWERVLMLEENGNGGCGHEKEMLIVQNDYEENERKLKAELEELKERLESEACQRKEAESYVSQRGEICNSLYAESTKLTNEIMALEKRVMDLVEENLELKEDLESAEAKSLKFKGHCDEYHEEYEQNIVKIEKLEKMLEEATNVEREATVQKLKEENEKLRKELSESVQQGFRVSSRQSDDRKKLQTKVESLEEQVQILQQKNDHLKKDLRRIHLQKLDTTNFQESKPNPTAASSTEVDSVQSSSSRPTTTTNFEMDLLRARIAELEREVKVSVEAKSLAEEDCKKMEAKLSKLINQIEISRAKKLQKENVLSSSSPDKAKQQLPGSPKSTVLAPRTMNRGNVLFTDDEVNKMVTDECKVS